MRYAGLALAAAVILAMPLAAGPGPGPIGSFRPIANFNVPVVGPSSAEIVSATPDGQWLVYTDALGDRLGLVDISDPTAPVQVDSLGLADNLGGSPTSVAVLPNGTHAVAAVQPGQLKLVSLDPFEIVSTLNIGSGPDAVAIAQTDGAIVAIVAIENEGGLPAGNVEVITLNLGNFPASSRKIVCFAGGPTCDVDASSLYNAAGPLSAADPQPEFVSVLGTLAAVTLQENNVIAVLNVANPAAPIVQNVSSAGVVANRPADLHFDNRIAFVESYPADVVGVPTAGARIPDAIGWSADGSTLFTADEGENNFEGGRGWSAHSSFGGALYDDGGSLEATAVRLGHYLDDRSPAKGIETEGLATAVFGQHEFLVVSSERGAFLAVYVLDGQNRPQFVQLLPTGPRPEGVLAIPSRNLLVTANEGSGGAVGGSISIFQGVAGRWNSSSDRPIIESSGVNEPWSALSSLAVDPSNPNRLFAVPDNALPSSLFAIALNGPTARLSTLAGITKNGVPAQYDFEGLVIDTSIRAPAKGLAFWTASEGNAATTRNMLVQINERGQVIAPEVLLPNSIDNVPNGPGELGSQGFEGVAVSSDGRYLLAAIQRPYTGEMAINSVLHTRIARYDLQTDTWEAFFYPLQPQPADDTPTIGLSEITLVGKSASGADIYAVIERDNRETFLAQHKRFTRSRSRDCRRSRSGRLRWRVCRR
jgi:hypothetical protein